MNEGSEVIAERKEEKIWNGPGKAIHLQLTQRLTLDLHGDQVVRSSVSPEAQTIHPLQKAEDEEKVGKDTLRQIVDLDLIGPTKE